VSTGLKVVNALDKGDAMGIVGALLSDPSLGKLASTTMIADGISFADGKIMVTSHGFMKMRDTVEEKKSREDYLKNNLEYIGTRLFGEKITDIAGIEFEIGEEVD
jgi:hypothetical protein